MEGCVAGWVAGWKDRWMEVQVGAWKVGFGVEGWGSFRNQEEGLPTTHDERICG